MKSKSRTEYRNQQIYQSYFNMYITVFPMNKTSLRGFGFDFYRKLSNTTNTHIAKDVKYTAIKKSPRVEERSVGAASPLTIRRKTPQRRSSCREARGLNRKGDHEWNCFITEDSL